MTSFRIRPKFKQLSPIAKEEINENRSKNIYHELRKYGYNVVGISYPEAFYYNKTHISLSTNNKIINSSINIFCC